ncbi:MAG: TIGR00725 family protein, partial [Dissulfurimicrobium sp.]
MMRRIGVIGAGLCDPEIAAMAEQAGRMIAERGAILYCGGLGGVMEAAAKGAFNAGGITVGILPGPKAADANPY